MYNVLTEMCLLINERTSTHPKALMSCISINVPIGALAKEAITGIGVHAVNEGGRIIFSCRLFARARHATRFGSVSLSIFSFITLFLTQYSVALRILKI